MAQVIVTLKIMPSGTDIDLDKLESEIKAATNPARINREPIAFGIVALNVIVLVEDDGEQLESVENKLKSIDGVGGVEVTEVTRAL